MNPKLQILLFILFATILFVFIRFFSSNPTSKQNDQNRTAVGQTILPTQAETVANEPITFVSNVGKISFDYPASWVSSRSADLVPDPSTEVIEETQTFMSPDSKQGVNLQITTNKKLVKTEALFGCGTAGTTCEMATAGAITYMKTTDTIGISRVGAVRQDKVYILKILGPPDVIISSLSFP